jgi:RNA polymerase sigma-70 factor (ECF subfamily)
MKELEPLVSRLSDSRQQFLALVADLRPELHRYCARMTGSIADGEDIVQETLARAYYALPEYPTIPALRPWLFRIAHNRALDHLRRYEQRMAQPLDAAEDSAGDGDDDPEGALAREHALHAAVSRFIKLAPAQRSCVILKDVLDHSLDEIAALLALSVPAVKAALHRGRTHLRDEPANVIESATLPASPIVARYAALFNARDWEGVRALLADEVRLDLVSRSRRSGRREVELYFTNYDQVYDWHMRPAWLGHAEVIAVYRNPDDAHPGYFIELTANDGGIALIRDFRYVPYVTQDAVFRFAQAEQPASLSDP